MRLALFTPVWSRSCAVCLTYLPQSNGTYLRNRETGELIRRTVEPTPCESCPKVPGWARGTNRDESELRKLAVEITPANAKAWDFYKRCKAVSRFPVDPVVDWYAGVIREVEDAWHHAPAESQAATMEALAMILLKRR